MFNRTFTMIRAVAALASALIFNPARMPATAATTGGHAPDPTPAARPRAARNAPRKRWGSTSQRRTQVGEMARRVSQIARGILTASNGLVGPSGAKVNSHGVL